jgi:hypothetical protein
MEPAQRFDGKKFMSDGRVYLTQEEAEDAARRYKANGFEARTQKADDGVRVFTRREVREIATESQEG